MEITTYESGRARITDGDKDLYPSEMDVRVWNSGHVQVGAGGRFLPVQEIVVGEMCKFKFGGYVVAVKRVEETETPPPAPVLVLRAYQAMRKPQKPNAGTGRKAAIIKLPRD